MYTGLEAAALSHMDFDLELSKLIQQVISYVTLFLGLFFYMKFFGSMAQLSENISTFSIRDAQCFCCSVGHCVPETGEEIPCDRRVVYGTLGMWYSGDDSTDPLELFDQEVRSHLAEFVEIQFGNGYFPLAYSSYMLIICRVCLAISFYGKDVFSPADVWVDLEPRASSPFFRMSKLVEDAVNFVFLLALLLAFVRLSQRMPCLLRSNRCLLLLVGVFFLLLEAVGRGHIQLLIYLQENVFEGVLAYQVSLAVICMFSIYVMASRSKARKTQRPKARPIGPTTNDH